MLGRFHELSVHAPDILASLDFYKTLGFSELEIGDIWPHKYAVVSDGNVCIGLHEREFDSPALTFVHRDIARHARSMTDRGFEFSYLRLDEDVFNELGFADPDGNAIAMIEARTFSPPPDEVGASLCGSWFELTLPVRDAMRAGRFWAPLAPAVLELREAPTTHLRFEAGGMALGLSESVALRRPALCFRCDDPGALASAAAPHGMRTRQNPGFEDAFAVLEAPEGTRLYVFDDDFLGATRTVDEPGAG